MEDNSIEELDRYLSKEFAYLGPEVLHKLLEHTLDRKMCLKGELERSKIMGSLLRRAYLVRSLGPSFISDSLTLGKDLTAAEARRPFHDRFAGREAGIRAELLPDNFYFGEDVAMVRAVLGLPGQGIETVPLDKIPKEFSWWQESPLDVRLLSNLWEDIHVAKATGEAYHGPELPPFIPEFLRNYLTASQAVPDVDKAPQWLNESPKFPWGQPIGYREDLPLHRYLGILLWRYGLPPRLYGRIRTYLFSNRQEDLRSRPGDPLEGTSLSVSFDFAQPVGPYSCASMTVNIQGIDAFTTAQEFNDIFENFIVPFQKSWQLSLVQIDFNQKHGRFPTLDEYYGLKKKLPQRAKPPFTKPFLYLPVWQYMHTKGVSLDKALETSEAWDKEGHFVGLNRRNAQRGVKRLEQIMKPMDSYTTVDPH